MFSPEALKKRRTELKISQADMARKLDISRQSYFTWESGKTKPNSHNIEKLADILGVSTGYFESEHRIVETYLKLNDINRVKVEEYAEEARIALQKAFNELHNCNIRFPKDVNK